MKIKKNKKIWKFSVISLFGILPIFLASCSAQTNLFEKTVSKQQGTYLDENTSLKDYALSSLKSDTGMKAYLSEITNQLVFKWLEKLSKTTNINFKNSFINQRKLIEDNYDNLVKSYQSKYKNDWALKFQQEVLDNAGGSEQAYKQSQWNSWAVSQFETYLFNKSYLTYKKDDGTIVNPSNISNVNVADIYNALEKQNLIFGFPTNDNSSSLSNDVIDKAYADFMQFIWDQYVQVVNPYVVDMSLWKYGTPSQGLGSLYTNATSVVTTENPDDSSNPSAPTDIATSSNIQNIQKNSFIINYKDDTTGESETGDDGSGDSGTTTTAAAASYIYPYFGNDAIGSTSGTVSKFISFINQANSATDSTVKLPTDSSTSTNTTKIPFKSSYDTNGYGLLYIPNSYTDDSSTFILAKNNSIYSDLYIEFAAASSYLFWRNSNSATDVNFKSETNGSSNSGIPNIDTKIQKDLENSLSINNNANTGLDTISNEFISTSSIFTDGDQYQIKLDKSYVNKIINQNGDLSKLRDKELYVVDSFIPKNKNLTNYMLLRNSAGVHAITIDGYNYINGSTTATSSLSVAEKKKRAGQVVLFRSLYNGLNSKDTSYSFAIDLQSELKTFYENNISWLIYLYASSKQDNILFNLNDLSLSENEKKAADAINNFLHEISFYKKVDEYNEALINGKSTYSTNYGTSVYENGLAAPWIYSSFSDNDANTYDSNKNISFQIAATVSSTLNPFSTSTNGQKNYDGSDFTSLTILDSNLQALANELTTLSLSFEGFKYSQFIYSNSSYVNAALLAYSNEGSNLPNLSKMNYLKKYIGDFFDFDNLKFSTLNVTYNSKTVDISKYLNCALSNFFFNSSFDSAQIKWLKLGKEDNEKWSNQIINNATSDLNEILQNYKVKLWKSENAVLSSTAIENYLKLYTTVAATKFMVENDFDFFLKQMTSLIGNGEDAYVVWQNSENRALEKQTNQNNSASALMSANKINRNINNSYFSSYIGGYKITNQESNSTKAPLTVTYQEELKNSEWTNSSNPNIGIYSSYQDSATALTYYAISNNMSGFLGLQKSSANNLNTIVSNRLFSSPTLDNKDLSGILYGYGSDLETVIKVIQNTQTIDGINTIANDLASKLKQNQLKEVAENKTITLKEKKEKLIRAVTNLSASLSSTKVFSQRFGILNEGYSTETNNNGLLSDSSQPLLQFAAYVIQLSRYDLLTSNDLLKALSVNETDTNSEGSFDILSNLIIQQAVDSSLQDRIINSILVEKGKIKAYDVRLYMFLGVEWILDWKVTNPFSTSGDSTSSETTTQPTT